MVAADNDGGVAPETVQATDTFSLFSQSDAAEDVCVAAMKVAPQLGCNLYSWHVHGRELLFTPPGFLVGQKRQGDHLTGGNPVLFPSVGRTWDVSTEPPTAAEYTVHGINGVFSMPVHGLADRGYWERVACFERPGTTGIQDTRSEFFEKGAQYRFRPAPDVQERHYPFDIDVQMEYALRRDSVKIGTTVLNRGSASAPFALGFHPYFRVTEKTGVRVELPCTHRLPLDPELLIPTGSKEPLSTRELRFAENATYDLAFTGTEGYQALIRDAHPGLDLRIGIDDAISTFVVYSGERTPFLCVEPWTAGLGAYAGLQQRNWQNAVDIPVLEPGDSWSISLSYAVVSH